MMMMLLEHPKRNTECVYKTQLKHDLPMFIDSSLSHTHTLIRSVNVFLRAPQSKCERFSLCSFSQLSFHFEMKKK